MLQRTLKRTASFVGVGLHSGLSTRVTVKPTGPDQGYVFRLIEGDAAREIVARVENVVDTQRCTTIAAGAARLHTIEHLLAALRGLGVDNAEIGIEGPEVPILDGSARGFVEFIAAAGVQEQDRPRRRLVIERRFRLEDDSGYIEVSPDDHFSVECTIEFAHPQIQRQSIIYRDDDAAFVDEIAPARTFGFVSELEKLREAGLIRGGSLENAVVFDETSCVNPDGLRFPDECVRHKVLDVIGDFSLVNAQIDGKVTAFCPGHSLNNRFLRCLLADPSAYRIEESGDSRRSFRARAPRKSWSNS
ncbi:MAG: UDP-3-O-[3-hydroxymyristoyl] N-acetylglucosamine deacetylase [Myxococcales bacterium]|nr:UDP-3-O-[3-hydroxymyristoyl] N-acetylglucosamine deacetylase [Myxococcales bacterium]